MKNDPPILNIASSTPDLYPHLKVTAEPFPRALATRIIENDEAEYFGAFLPKTATRILMDFINRVFRLRTCDIAIDGTFPAPCTQYYRKRCVAPCVASICSPEQYMELVGLLRLFLADQRGALRKALRKHIRDNSNELDFEEAAYWRDMLDDAEKYWKNPRWAVWLDSAVDTYEIENTDAGVTAFLVTQRGRNVVGRKVFTFSSGEPISPDEALSQIIGTFYRFHAPREIVVPVDLADRRLLATELSTRFGREIKISMTRAKKRVASGRALTNSRDESELDKVKPRPLPGEIGRILRDEFKLSKPVSRVEAFDVAHISGKAFVTATSIWRDGRFHLPEYRFITGHTSELRSLTDAVMFRLSDPWHDTPSLLLIDGGMAQLNAVMAGFAASNVIQIPIVAAVKPPGKHNHISRFLIPDGTEVAFDATKPAHAMLQLLRDDAHDLANRVHRDLRDMGHHYELAAILPTLTERERRRLIVKFGSVKKLLAIDKTELRALAGEQLAETILSDINSYLARESGPILPFVVPIRYDAEGGNADDMRPIGVR